MLVHFKSVTGQQAICHTDQTDGIVPFLDTMSPNAKVICALLKQFRGNERWAP